MKNINSRNSCINHNISEMVELIYEFESIVFQFNLLTDNLARDGITNKWERLYYDLDSQLETMFCSFNTLYNCFHETKKFNS